jgi:hypothetical protein
VCPEEVVSRTRAPEGDDPGPTDGAGRREREDRERRAERKKRRKEEKERGDERPGPERAVRRRGRRRLIGLHPMGRVADALL